MLRNCDISDPKSNWKVHQKRSLRTDVFYFLLDVCTQATETKLVTQDVLFALSNSKTTVP